MSANSSVLSLNLFQRFIKETISRVKRLELKSDR